MLDVVQALEGPIAPMECSRGARGEGPVLARDRRRPRVRDQGPVDPGPGGVTKALAGTSLAEAVMFANQHERKDTVVGRIWAPPPGPSRKRLWPIKSGNLHVRAEGKQILRGLDLEIAQGRDARADGPNGSGKSTATSTRSWATPGSRSPRARSFRGGHHRRRSRRARADGLFAGLPVRSRSRA